MSNGNRSRHRMGESLYSKMEREEIQRRVVNVEEDRKEAAKQLASLLNASTPFRMPELRGNSDGSISIYHPIDDVFAQMVKDGLIKPKGQE